MELTLPEVTAYIQDTFPTVESPSLFGLHENAEISYQRTESNNIISFIMQMMPQEQAAGTGLSVQERDA